jgi:hypothetical protein
MHHIRKLGGKNAKGFAQIMGRLGRKQVPLCKECHYMVHRGLYNGLGLRDLFATKLAASEGDIVYTDPKVPDVLRWDDPRQKPEIKNQQIRIKNKDAYVLSEKYRRIVSKNICIYEHEPDKYKTHEHRFDDWYYETLLKNYFNRPLELK